MKKARILAAAVVASMAFAVSACSSPVAPGDDDTPGDHTLGSGNHTLGSGNHTLGSGNHTIGSGN